MPFEQVLRHEGLGNGPVILTSAELHGNYNLGYVEFIGHSDNIAQSLDADKVLWLIQNKEALSELFEICAYATTWFNLKLVEE